MAFKVHKIYKFTLLKCTKKILCFFFVHNELRESFDVRKIKKKKQNFESKKRFNKMLIHMKYNEKTESKNGIKIHKNKKK